MTKQWDKPFWIGERMFSEKDFEIIIWTVNQYKDLSRTELALTICENINWKAPNGKLRLHSCLDLLDKLSTEGVIELPEKRKLAPYKKSSSTTMPLAQVCIECSLKSIRPVTVLPVPPEEQSLWDATMAEYHPFGFQRAFGAHQRYWIYGHMNGEKVILGAFLFAAPAKNVKVRDLAQT